MRLCRSLTLAAVALALAVAGATAKAQTTVQVPYSGTVPATPYGGNVPVTVVCPSGSATISGTTITCPSVSPSPPPGPTRTKLVPSGSDDKPQIYAAAAKGPIELSCPTPGTPCTFTQTPISFPPKTDLYCDDFVTVSDMPGYTPYAVLWQVNAAGAILTASNYQTDPNACHLTMPNSYKKNVASADQNVNQYNHCLQLYGATSPVITGFYASQCGGDSLYLGGGGGTTDAVINFFTSSDPVRNGFSVTDLVTNGLIENSVFGGARNLKNAGIADGGDIEPNAGVAGQHLSLKLVNNKFLNNAGDGLCSCNYFMPTTVPIDVTLTGNISTGSGLNNFNSNGPQSGVKQSGNSWNQ